MQLDTLKARLNARAADTLDELDGYFPNETELIDAIKDDGNDRIEEATHEMADGRVSVYTYDRMQWLTNNIGHADQENAIACGAKTAEQIAAFCWYDSEREDIGEDIEDMRRILNEETE